MMRSPIPKAIRGQLAEDPYMKECCLKGIGLCDGRIEWHHAFKYASKRQNELWSLLPVCAFHHRHEAAFSGRLNGFLRDRIKHFHAEADFAAKYPRSTLIKSIT